MDLMNFFNDYLANRINEVVLEQILLLDLVGRFESGPVTSLTAATCILSVP